MSPGTPARIALPETRQLDVLAGLLERRGAAVRRCPLIAIRDNPDRAAIGAWLERFCAGAIDFMIIYTGEGVRRLVAAAEAAGLGDRFRDRLRATPLLTRGPKPARALHELGIRPEHPAVRPTTAGVIETLASIDVAGRRVGVQLYGAQPLAELEAYLGQHGATADWVAPYVYAAESEDAAVQSLIADIVTGEVDAIAFTSKAQVGRLLEVADGAGTGDALRSALAGIVVAAVGPVAAAELAGAGIRVDVVPESDWFMKPMVSALLGRLGG